MAPIIKADPFECLCEDLIGMVLSRVTVTDLARCSQVSKKWRQVLENSDFWMTSFRTFWANSFPFASFPEKRVQRAFSQCCAFSKEDLIEQIENYISLMPRNSGGFFTCVFPIQSHYQIFAKIFYGIETKSPENRFCIFLGSLSNEMSNEAGRMKESRLGDSCLSGDFKVRSSDEDWSESFSGMELSDTTSLGLSFSRSIEVDDGSSEGFGPPDGYDSDSQVYVSELEDQSSTWIYGDQEPPMSNAPDGHVIYSLSNRPASNKVNNRYGEPCRPILMIDSRGDVRAAVDYLFRILREEFPPIQPGQARACRF